MQQKNLAPEEIRNFRALAGVIIPKSDTYQVPGADDDAIFAEILKSLERDVDDVRRALTNLASLCDRPFADLEP